MTMEITEPMTKETGVRRGTGREKADWFAVLDEWGADGRPYRETAAWLRDQHGISAWWAQKITVEYEQARGTRPPGIRRDGTFEVTGSKSIAAPAERVLEAFTNARLRKKWLPDATLRARGTEAADTARFDWGDDGERLSVTVAASGAGRSQVAIGHDHLPDADAATAAKAAWRERLSALKDLLEP